MAVGLAGVAVQTTGRSEGLPDRKANKTAHAFGLAGSAGGSGFFFAGLRICMLIISTTTAKAIAA